MTIKHELIIDPALLLPENSKEAQDAKKSAIKSIADRLRANAWQLARWPLVKNMTWDRIQIHLPRSYLAKDGEDVRAIHQGSDINEFVYQHYLEPVDLKTNTWVNFVHADNVVAKRHEFLGPDPRVAGYFFDHDGHVYIRWWDGFLNDQWMGTQKWKIGVSWDGERWNEKLA